MKNLMLLMPGVLAVLVPECSNQALVAAAAVSPPAKLVEGGWKASWSPDGAQVIYGKGAGAGLERLNIATGVSTPVLSNAKDACWSPNGRRIAFVREESYNSYLTEEVWICGSDGKDPHKIVTGGFPSWSRDGGKLFVHWRQENQILAVDPEDLKAEPAVFFANTPSWYFAVSPDETRIAFGCTGRLEIRDRLTGKILSRWPTPQDRGLLPAWSPDGKLVAFGGFDSSQLGLWVFEVASERAAQVAQGNYTMPAWKSDGSTLAFDSRTGERAIWTVSRAFVDSKLVDARTAPPLESLAQQQQPVVAESDTRALEGRPAPEFKLHSLDGTQVSLSQFKGDTVVIDFWATWCPPCRKSLPHIQQISQEKKLRQKGLKILAVDLRESKDKVQSFLEENKYTFPVALDADGGSAEKYLIRGIPTTVVIDKAGVVRKVFIGFGDDSQSNLDKAISDLLPGD